MKREHFRSGITSAPRSTLLQHAAAAKETIRWALLIIGFLFSLDSATASGIACRITNRSTGRPAASDEVILYRVDRSMHKEQRAKSNERGGFHFESEWGGRHLIAVLHQKVYYHSKVTNGTGPLEVSVYDAVPVLREVHEESETLFFEGSAGTLKITEFFVLSNRSNPPQTLAANNTFDFVLPRQAALDSVAVQPPDTLPLRTSVSPHGHRGRYGVSYPIRPGVTKVRVVYHLPHSGKVSLTPTVLHPVAAMALMVPQSMRMVTGQPDAFAYHGEQNGLSVYVANYLRPGTSSTFSLSGTGRSNTSYEANAMAGGSNFSGTVAHSAPPHPFVAAQLDQQVISVTQRNLFLRCAFLMTAITGLLIATNAFKKGHHDSAEKP